MKIKLLCFGYAGGSAMFYNSWMKDYENIEVIPVELPGRGSRLAEPALDCLEMIIANIYSDVIRHIEGDYAFFGHSMGTIIIYEIMKKLMNTGKKMPMHIFMSGRFPPHIKSVKRISELDELLFREEIYNLGGTPEEILKDPYLWNYFTSILRKDYRAIEDYSTDTVPMKWNVNMTVLYGESDEEINQYGYEEWKLYTKCKCSIIGYPGDHFFIHTHKEHIERQITETVLLELARCQIMESLELSS